MNEYKINPINPYTFEILVKKVYKKGILWWRKTFVDFVPCNCAGFPYDERMPSKVILPRCGHFTNEAAAMRRIRQFEGEQTLHTFQYDYSN